MSSAEVFVKEAEALLAPISAAEPGGKNPSADENYQELRVEVDKENSPRGEPVGWDRVAELGAQILGKVAKDLLVAAYSAFALFKTRGLHGMAVGVLVVDGLLDRYWDTMFPPPARAKGRGTALKWFLEHALGGLQGYRPRPEERGALQATLAAGKQLRGRAREKLGEHAPAFKDWIEQLERVAMALPPEEAKPEPPRPEPPRPEPPRPEPVPEILFPETAPTSGSGPAAPVVPPVAPVVTPPVVTPPAAPARPTPKDLAGPWLAPIAGANPAGRDAAESTEFQTVLAEIDKLQSPTGGAIQWGALVESADVVLQKQSKDLRVACHQALGRYKTGGLAGLALGLAITAEVVDAFWDTAFPPVARLRGRAGALRAMLDQLEPELTAHKPAPTERANIELLRDCTSRLANVVRARYADQAPSLRLLLQTIDRMLLTVPEAPKPEAPKPEPVVAAPPRPEPPRVEAPPPPPPPAASAAPAAMSGGTGAPVDVPRGPAASAPAGDAMTSAAVDKFLRGTGEELVKLAHALRRARTADPLSYRLLRSGLWIYMAAAPPVKADGNTAIGGLSDKDRGRLDAMQGGGKWAELVEASESLLPANRFALDLNRYTAEGLRNLAGEHEAGLRGLVGEVGALLGRMPKLAELKDNAGKPLCDEATRAWLGREVLGGKGGGAGAPAAAAGPVVIAAAPAASGIDDATVQQIKALLKGNKRDEALKLGAGRIHAATSGRSRFLRRVELAEACVDGGEVALARSIYAGLAVEGERLQLEAWEPELVARCLEGQIKSLPKGQPAEKAAVEAALGRLAGLDPIRAAGLVPRG